MIKCADPNQYRKDIEAIEGVVGTRCLSDGSSPIYISVAPDYDVDKIALEIIELFPE